MQPARPINMQILVSLHSAPTFVVALCAALLLTAVGRAQEVPSGLLGQRYADVNFDVVDFSKVHDYGYSTGLSLNLPADPNVDVGLGYTYGWVNITGTALREHTLLTSLVWHALAPGPKPFVGAGLGYDWARQTFGPFKANDKAGVWGLGTGVEIPVGAFTFTPSVSYSDRFETHHSGAMNYHAEANYWFTPEIAGYANLTYSDYASSSGNSWTYRTGLRFKF